MLFIKKYGTVHPTSGPQVLSLKARPCHFFVHSSIPFTKREME